MLVFLLHSTTLFPFQGADSSSGVDPAERSFDPADTSTAWSSVKKSMAVEVQLPLQP